jgi:hypothetical protein
VKANIESSSTHISFKRLVSGAFNVGLIGSTCTALPLHVFLLLLWDGLVIAGILVVAAQVEIESKIRKRFIILWLQALEP